MIILSRLGAARILPEARFEKFWSTDGLSNQWASAGRELVSYFCERPEYVKQYRKVGQYLATKTLILHIRHPTLQASLAMPSDFIRSDCLTKGLCTSAATTFMGNELDLLVVGNCVLQKATQNHNLKSDYSSAFDPD